MTQTSLSPPDDAADRGERVEHGWAAGAVAILGVLVVMATFAALHLGAMPQSRVETADPLTLHLGGEFIDSNLGSALEPDGSVTVRAIGQQYSFTPSCIVVPTDTPVTFRATSVVSHAKVYNRLGPAMLCGMWASSTALSITAEDKDELERIVRSGRT